MHKPASLERQAFTYWLRTGRLPRPRAADGRELKFNPYHDPDNGRFTFAPGGPRSLRSVVVSDKRRAKAPTPDMNAGATARLPKRRLSWSTPSIIRTRATCYFSKLPRRAAVRRCGRAATMQPRCGR